MKSTIHVLLIALTIALALPVNVLARDVYSDQNLDGIYVLGTEGGRALVKAKGREAQYIAAGDSLGEERLIVVRIDSLSVTVESEYGGTAARLPVGGGIGN